VLIAGLSRLRMISDSSRSALISLTTSTISASLVSGWSRETKTSTVLRVVTNFVMYRMKQDVFTRPTRLLKSPQASEQYLGTQSSCVAYPQRSDQWLYSLHQRVTASVLVLAVGTEQLPVIKLAKLHHTRSKLMNA